MVICLVFFTDSGVCVQFVRKRKFMYVFDNYLRLLLVQYLVLYEKMKQGKTTSYHRNSNVVIFVLLLLLLVEATVSIASVRQQQTAKENQQ